MGCGMWHPGPDALRAVREAIDDDPKGWKRVRDAKRLRDIWEFGGESLKRAPRGYHEDHPMIEDLKRKDHIVFDELPDKALTAPGLIENVSTRFRRAAPYLRWQADALGLAF